MSSKAPAAGSESINAGLFYSLIIVISAGVGVYGLMVLLSLLQSMMARIQQ